MRQHNWEKIQELSGKFRWRSKRGSDEKRHDRVRKDEARAMLKAESYGLTPEKIAEVFGRDVRTVTQKLEQEKQEPGEGQKLVSEEEHGKPQMVQAQVSLRAKQEAMLRHFADLCHIAEQWKSRLRLP